MQKNKTETHILTKDVFNDVFVNPENRISKRMICG